MTTFDFSTKGYFGRPRRVALHDIHGSGPEGEAAFAPHDAFTFRAESDTTQRAPRRRFATGRRIAAVLAILPVLALGTPAAASTLDLSAVGEAGTLVSVSPVSYVQFFFQEQLATVPINAGLPGNGTKAEILRTSPVFTGGTPFPTGNRDPLISAVARDDGLYGAGVSAGFIGRPGFLRAEARLTYTFVNDTAFDTRYQPTVYIPDQSVAIAGFGSPSADLSASSLIGFTKSLFDASGKRILKHVYDPLSIEVYKLAAPGNIWTTGSEASDFLLQVVDDLGLTISTQDVTHRPGYYSTTITVPGYELVFDSGVIKPGGSFVLDLFAEAYVDVGPLGGEQGGQAFAGDPFNLVVPSGPTYFIDAGGITPPTSSVPLPASGLLLLGALALIGRPRHRRRQG